MKSLIFALLFTLTAPLAWSQEQAQEPAEKPSDAPREPGSQSAPNWEAPAAYVPPGEALIEFQAAPVTLTTPLGAFPLWIELAQTPSQMQRGLMYRPALPDDYGMLFVFPFARQQSFWMRNTLSPLDIIYIGSDWQVVSIAKGEPLNETALPSDGPAQFVLEVREGLAARYGIELGASLRLESRDIGKAEGVGEAAGVEGEPSAPQTQ